MRNWPDSIRFATFWERHRALVDARWVDADDDVGNRHHREEPGPDHDRVRRRLRCYGASSHGRVPPDVLIPRLHLQRFLRNARRNGGHWCVRSTVFESARRGEMLAISCKERED